MKETKREILVKNIKNRCLKLGINISQLEEDLNFSSGLISRWVRMSPSIEKIADVADYLHMSIDDLVGRNESEKSDTFIEKLCELVIEKEIRWMPCGFGQPFRYPLGYLKELRGENWLCGYCTFGSGFFILACAMSEDGIETLRFYIIPDENSAPTFQEIDADELLPLFDLVKEDISWKENKRAAEQLVHDFMEM